MFAQAWSMPQQDFVANSASGTIYLKTASNTALNNLRPCIASEQGTIY
jgi:hypothetical protein